nr:hypothetical protein [Tanacetum cinerariifolium]
MVNTRTNTDLYAAVQNALQTLLPQIRAEIREEFRTCSGPSDAGVNPPPVTIHTWLERFNKQKPYSFEKATAPHAFKTRLAVYKFEGNALAWWKAYKQAKGGDAWLVTTNTETSTEFMQRFLRLAGFLGAAAGTEKEQAKNFQWGLRRSTLNHLMCMSYTDVAQVANAARNYEILHERDDDDTERPDKRKTPYELLHDKLPDLSFFHIFGALCYPTNDSKNLGKLQPKADIAMASEQSSSGPALHEMTSATISSGLMPNPTSSTPFVPPPRTDWDMLFQPLFDELLTPPPSVDHRAPKVISLIVEVVTPEPTASTSSPSSTTVDQDAPSPSNSQTTPKP